jgi:ribosomal protein L37AE/L43A
MNGLMCPNCKIDKHEPISERDGLYVCSKCGGIIGYYCKGCDKIYLENRLGRRRDEWVCKECNMIQWGYTAYKRKELNIPE